METSDFHGQPVSTLVRLLEPGRISAIQKLTLRVDTLDQTMRVLQHARPYAGLQTLHLRYFLSLEPVKQKETRDSMRESLLDEHGLWQDAIHGLAASLRTIAFAFAVLVADFTDAGLSKEEIKLGKDIDGMLKRHLQARSALTTGDSTTPLPAFGSLSVTE